MSDRPTPPPSQAQGLGLEFEGTVRPTATFELPDLTVAEPERLRLRRGLVAAHIELALPADGVAIHESLVEHVRERLAGREALVWQEPGRFNMSFGAFAHTERDHIEDFALDVARILGATVVFATTVGLVVPADADFLT
ncbi:hypothetical protein [uncultured Nocardioides sp.]|uniref:hypothetical protein n=1 Tax=uncultured Nocardioides sp. TaxID=198441 RepID=UPI00262D175E|nr:hypothetical protein [uncultured Nocardioides sp.]